MYTRNIFLDVIILIILISFRKKRFKPYSTNYFWITSKAFFTMSLSSLKML